MKTEYENLIETLKKEGRVRELSCEESESLILEIFGPDITINNSKNDIENKGAEKK